MDLFEIKTGHETYEVRSYKDAVDIYNQLTTAALYVVHFPGGEIELLMEKEDNRQTFSHAIRVAGLSMAAMLSCGFISQEAFWLWIIFMFFGFLSFITGYIVARSNHRITTEQVIQEALEDIKNLKDQNDNLKRVG